MRILLQKHLDNEMNLASRSYPLLQYLDKLKSAGKTCFLITNSPYALVNAGMGHLV